MNQQQFENLQQGDVVQDREGLGWVVLHATPENIVCQRTATFHRVSADRLTHVFSLTAAISAPPKKYPPVCVMTQELFEAGFTRIEKRNRVIWESPKGRTVETSFSRIENAYDWLCSNPSLKSQPAQPKSTTRIPLETKRRKLREAGWVMTETPGGVILWSSPSTGEKVRWTAYAYARAFKAA